ncbi:MAG: AraC family transcriptional regulator [Polyangiaceae bacterium]
MRAEMLGPASTAATVATGRDTLSDVPGPVAVRAPDAPSPLQRLRAFAGEAFDGARSTEGHGIADVATITQVSTRTRQSVRTERHPRAILVAVLEGQKRIQAESTTTVVGPGDLVVMPAARPLCLVNCPDARSGRYRAVCIDVGPRVAAGVAARLAELALASPAWLAEGARPEVVRMDAPLCEALLHFCQGLLAAEAHPALHAHRLAEVLLALALQGGALRPALDDDVVLAVRRRVRAAPAGPVGVERLARDLGASAATLRRRMAARGLSIARVVRDERMAMARLLILDDALSVAEVAARCGYASPSKFARRFAEATGAAPLAYRKRARSA